jgi:hypothetical protein
MSLVALNVSKSVHPRDLEREFEEFGKCTVRTKVRFTNYLTSVPGRNPMLLSTTITTKMLRRP